MNDKDESWIEIINNVFQPQALHLFYNWQIMELARFSFCGFRLTTVSFVLVIHIAAQKFWEPGNFV